MGFGNRRPILPAPTDSVLESADDTGLGTDVATDLSRRTDRTHHTIPDDGSPITIATGLKKSIGKLTKPGQHSQTSLLIEYFEGSKDSNQKPSVRVKLRPSSSKANKEKGEGHAVLTKAHGDRKPHHSHKISTDSYFPEQIINESEISSLPPEVGLHNTRTLAETELLGHDKSHLSGMSDSPEARYIVAESDISSMPADSMLGTNVATMGVPPKIKSFDQEEVMENNTLKPPVIPRERNLSNERITQKVIEKLSNKPRTSGGRRHHNDTSKSRSNARRENEALASGGPIRRRLAKNIEDDSATSATASSLVSGSLLSADPRSVDQRSARSGASGISITNPRLLQTVEDVVRRLILPELKEIKKDRRHGSHYNRYEKDTIPSDLSESSLSREEITKRRSSDGKSRRRISKGSGDVLTSDSRKHHRRHKTLESNSPSEKSYRYSESLDSVSVDDDPKLQKHGKHRRVRDATAGALAGAALTAAALKHHDSGSTLDHQDRHKRRSKSRSSRSASITESEEIFQKHNVPPMPMRSEVGSELTRSSLLSSNTDGTATPTRREVRQVVRGSSAGLPSPQMPNSLRNSGDIKQGLGTHHGNFSEHNLTGHHDDDAEERYEEAEEHQDRYDSNFSSTPLATHGFLTDAERVKAYERNLHNQHPIRRGLSPIQSVASYATTEANRNSMIQPRSSESLSSLKKANQARDRNSLASVSSAPSTDLTRSNVTGEFSPEFQRGVDGHHYTSLHRANQNMDAEDFFDEQHAENDQYRDPYSHTQSQNAANRDLPFEDDQLHSPYIDKITAGQHFATGYASNPQYVHTPPAVESAVASLYEPSLVEAQNTRSAHSSHSGSIGNEDMVNARNLPIGLKESRSDSPLKHDIRYGRYDNLGHNRSKISSSPYGIDRSIESLPAEGQKTVRTEVVSVPVTAEGQDAISPQSEITTNPSPIQGPAGGLIQNDPDHWTYDPSTPRSNPEAILPASQRDLAVGGEDLVPQALSINRGDGLDSRQDTYAKGQPLSPLTPPGIKDEGYETGANPRSPDLYTTGNKIAPNTRRALDIHYQDPLVGEDPFTSTDHDPYLDDMARGITPAYDGARDAGMDGIQSQDVVALMDHLTMRDAQRNARDTEILVTLVRSAAEMRNSFEDMKLFIAQQDEAILDAAEKQHEKTQKIVGGPRPQPGSSVQFARSEDEEFSTKRRNVFKRALRGLGSKNSQELQNIEGMLMQLLGDVEALRGVHGAGPIGNENRLASFTSAERARLPTDPGYEPEGQAGTSSTGDRSGFFSNNSSRQGDYRAARRSSGNRVSTVMEGDEDAEQYTPGMDGEGMIDEDDPQRTPRGTPPLPENQQTKLGPTAHFNTPPRAHEYSGGTMDNDNTPHLSTEGNSSRKHRSFVSSFLPKVVSRWSKTTASSTGDGNRSSTQTKPRPYSQVSQSGSHLDEYDYDPQGDDRLRSNTSLDHGDYRDRENRPPSPLIPSQVSEKPKYQAHRNSINLQHPQPRQGPTGRYQHQLESEARNYYPDDMSPMSQTSSQWENQGNLTSMVPDSGNHNQGRNLSPISDRAYSGTSSPMVDRNRYQDVQSPDSITSLNKQGPPRPPKVHDNTPLVPPRPPKITMSPPGNRGQTYVDHVAAARAGSPAVDKSPVSALRASSGQVRKPSGPRPLGSPSQPSKLSAGDLNAVKRTRFRGSPNQIDSEEDVTY